MSRSPRPCNVGGCRDYASWRGRCMAHSIRDLEPKPRIPTSRTRCGGCRRPLALIDGRLICANAYCHGNPEED